MRIFLIKEYTLLENNKKQKPKIIRYRAQQLNSVKVKSSGFSEKVFAYKNLRKNIFQKTLTECHAHFQKAFFFSFFLNFFSSFSFRNISTEKFKGAKRRIDFWFEF